MALLTAFGFEAVENIPVWIGVVCAGKLWAMKKRWQAVLLYLIASFLTSVLIAWLEPTETTEAYATHIGVGDVLISTAIFGLLGLPFVVYLSVNNKWVNWRSDLGLALLSGVGTAVAQFMAMSGEVGDNLWLLHGIAIALASMLSLSMMRLLVQRPWKIAIGGAVPLVIVVSGVITAIDYLPRMHLFQ